MHNSPLSNWNWYINSPILSNSPCANAKEVHTASYRGDVSHKSILDIKGTFGPSPWGKAFAASLGLLGPASAILLAQICMDLGRQIEVRKGGEDVVGAPPLMPFLAWILP